MNEKELIEKLKTIITPYVDQKSLLDSLSLETDFINDLQINSAHLVDVVLDVEDVFDIEIDNDSMELMTNVKNSLEVIESKLAEK